MCGLSLLPRAQEYCPDEATPSHKTVIVAPVRRERFYRLVRYCNRSLIDVGKGAVIYRCLVPGHRRHSLVRPVLARTLLLCYRLPTF